MIVNIELSGETSYYDVELEDERHLTLIKSYDANADYYDWELLEDGEPVKDKDLLEKVIAALQSDDFIP